MASIRKRGNSYLLVVSMGYTPDGRRRNPQQTTVKPPTGLTPKQTEKWLQEQAMLFEMSCKKLNPDIDRSITLEKYTEIWLQTIAPDKLAKSTLVREKQDIERFKPYLGSYKLVDLRPEHFRVCRNAVKTTGDEIIVKAPKTKAGNRYVYFSAEMESLLREYEAFCAAETERYDRRKQTKDDYVFRRKGMKLPMTPSTFTWRFKKILKANDFPTDLNVHSLRHTAASLFIASGTDVVTVAGLLGHSQPSTTLDIYTHAFDKNKKAASQIMQSSLEI